MTINHKDYLQFPSRELFLECLNERTYPFSIRARIVKAYRKMISKGILPPVRLEPLIFPEPMEYPDVLVEEPFKTAKEKKLERAKDRIAKTLSRHKKERDCLNQDQGSPENARSNKSSKLTGANLGILSKEQTDEKKEKSASKIEVQIQEGIKQGKISQRNSKVRNALKPVVRWTSGGRNRPSRKRKVQHVATPYTIHLRGNKYSGGQDEF